MGLWVSVLHSFLSKLCSEGKEGLLKKLCPLSLTLTHSQLKLQPWCVSACACYWEPPLLYSSTAQYQRLISINILYELSQNLVKGESNGGRKEDSSSLFSKGNAFQKEPTSICLIQHNSFVVISSLGCYVDQIEQKESKTMFLPKARGWQYEIKRLKREEEVAGTLLTMVQLGGLLRREGEEAKLLW